MLDQINSKNYKNQMTNKYTLSKTIMKTNTEKIMDKLCGYLDEITLELIISVQHELYEDAADLRDDIELKIERVIDLLIRYKYTTLDREELKLQLDIVKHGYLKKWYEYIEVPTEQQIYNI